MSNYLLNFTELDDKEALEKLTVLRDLVLRGESDRSSRLERFVETNDIWLNNIWSTADLEFFAKLDIVPYEFPVQRPLINNLISRQRNRQVGFDIVPTDIHSYKRHREGKEQFVAEEMAKEDSAFTTPEEAGKFYDNYADDEYAKAASILLHNIRHESKAFRVDSGVFQQGVISGFDMWKATYSTKYNREGSVEITRRPQNAIFYDESSIEQDLSDVEFIGEVYRYYKQDLLSMYPSKKKEIEEFFKHYTNKSRRSYTKEDQDWKYFYQFDFDHAIKSRLRVAEIWCRETEDRIQVTDLDNNDVRVVQFGIEEDEVMDSLMSKVLLELQAEAETKPEIEQMLQSPTIKADIAELVESRFQIDIIQEPVWYKAVMTYNGLLEYTRSELPHNSHPYFPFFAQFTEGEFRGVIDDIKDIIISINKTLAFRDLMLSHSAKNVLVVDKDALAKSGYSLDDIAEDWTSIGSIIALKLAPNKNIGDVIQSISTVGDTLMAINNVLMDLDNRLNIISGVNLAQLGITERETTYSGYRDQVAQGETNNGLIYDNFYSALECFYNEKVVPLVVSMMRVKKITVLRMIGEEHAPWVNIDISEDFDLFEDAVRNGQYNTLVRPKNENAQLQQERSAKYMEMAMAGMLDPEIAIEFSTDPDRHKLLKKMKEKEIERIRRQANQQFSFQEFLEMAQTSGLPADAVSELLDKMKKQNMLQQYQTQQGAPSGQQVQRQQGAQGRTAAPNIRTEANESARMNGITASASGQGAQ